MEIPLHDRDIYVFGALLQSLESTGKNDPRSPGVWARPNGTPTREERDLLWGRGDGETCGGGGDAEVSLYTVSPDLF